MSANQTREQQLDGYLGGDAKPAPYGTLYRRLNLDDHIERYFLHVKIDIDTDDRVLPVGYQRMVNDLYENLEPITYEMVGILKQGVEDYCVANLAEMSRRENGEEPIQQDELGEWLIKSQHLSTNAILSIMGSIIDQHQEIYDEIDNCIESIVRRKCGNNSVWIKRSFDEGRYAFEAENDMFALRVRYGHPCPRISQMTFE